MVVQEEGHNLEESHHNHMQFPISEATETILQLPYEAVAAKTVFF